MATGRPRIFTYFKRGTIDIDDACEEDVASLRRFQRKLGELGHFYTRYSSIEGLKLQFRDQLDKLLERGTITPSLGLAD